MENTDLEFIKQYISENDKAPSFVEIAKGLNISKTTARNRVDKLIEKGKIIRVVGLWRSMKIVD